ncbi:chromosome partitioning protein [Gammaproteobacteria bacterium]
MTPPVPDRPAVLAIVSLTEGAAKTTTAVNLSIALAAVGQTVLLVDLDPKGHASESLVRGRPERGGIHRALAEAVITRDMITATEVPDLYLISADEDLGQAEIELSLAGDGRTRLYQALGTLGAFMPHFDVVILDCPHTLGFITLNALSAAQWVFVLIRADHPVLDGLPALLKAIHRLRAGLKQPLLGVHLLVTLGKNLQLHRYLMAELRQDYSQMSLMTEIPWSETVREAAVQSQPVLTHALRGDVSQAYLALAAEWLSLTKQTREEGVTPWSFKIRQEFMTRCLQEMQRRIEAWLMDPSSLLFDADEATHYTEIQVLEELFSLTRQMNRPRFSLRRLVWMSLIALAVTASLVLVVWIPPWFRLMDGFRLEAGAWMIGTDRYWQAGSLLLARSDEAAYRELILASRLVDGNRAPLQTCAEQARQTGSAVPCTLQVEPWR